jgi:hypothetical protein
MQGLSRFRGLLIAILIPYLWLAAVRLVSLDEGGETSADSYFHVGMADVFPEGCVAKTFPWMSLSLWTDRYYDKELLFHGILSVCRTYTHVLGLPLGPPFHVPALMFDLALIATFAMAAWSMRIPRIYFFVAALVVLCPFFTQRLLMLRPHVLAVTIMLAYCWHLTRVRRAWPSFVFGFVTAYSYSNPHFILLPAAVFAFLKFRTDRKLALFVPLATLAGLLAGLTLHPQFPNTFALWKIQCVDVIRQTVLQDSPIYLGTELYGPNLPMLGQNAAVFILALLNAFALRWFVSNVSLRKVPLDTALFLILQAVTTLGVFSSKRVMEYAWPFAVLATGLLCRDLLNAGFFKRFTDQIRQRALLGAHIAIAAAFCVFGIYMLRWVWPYQTRELRLFGQWAEKNLPVGINIANPNWSDFPVLFYSAPQFRYTLGIEPMFGYNAHPREVAKLEAFRTGRLMLTPRELRDLTQARFAFVSARSVDLARDMHLSGYYFVYQEDDGWLFDLEHVTAPPPASPPKSAPKPAPKPAPKKPAPKKKK